MTHLLDTDICIHLLNRRTEQFQRRLESVGAHAVAVSTVTVGELRFGAWRSPKITENLRLLDCFLEPFIVLPFAADCAAEYGRLRAHLAAHGTPIGPNDTLIAATAVSQNLTLVTGNTREFERVPGLRLENWTAAEHLPPNPIQP